MILSGMALPLPATLSMLLWRQYGGLHEGSLVSSEVADKLSIVCHIPFIPPPRQNSE
jgi:hypothetical protein